MQGHCDGTGQFKEWKCGALHRLPDCTKAKHAGTRLEFNESVQAARVQTTSLLAHALPVWGGARLKCVHSACNGNPSRSRAVCPLSMLFQHSVVAMSIHPA